jgi:uncharacterized protein (TIRG00374 family)
MKKFKVPNPAQIIKWIIIIVVLVLLVNYLIKNWDEFHFLTKIRTEYIIPIILLNTFTLFLSYYRFDMMLAHVSHRISRYMVFKYFVFGRIINRFLPYGGSVYRAIMFKKSNDVSYKKFIATNIAFDWLNLFYATIFGIVVIGVYDPQLKIRSIPILLLFIVALVFLILGIPLTKAVLSLISRSVSSESFRLRIDKIAEIVERFIDVLRNRPIFFSNSIIITLIIVGSLFSFYLLFKSIGVDMDLALLFVYLILLRFFRAMRITPANLGIREFLLGFLTHSLGIGAAEGIAVAIMMRVVTLCVQGGLSLGIFAVEGIKRIND